MKFDIKEWGKFYNKIQSFGQMLKDSRPSMGDDKRWKPAVLSLDESAQKMLEKKIETLVDRCKIYLDNCNMRMPEPLWIYNNNDPTTWTSNKSFKYGHLMKWSYK